MHEVYGKNWREEYQLKKENELKGINDNINDDSCDNDRKEEKVEMEGLKEKEGIKIINRPPQPPPQQQQQTIKGVSNLPSPNIEKNNSNVPQNHENDNKRSLSESSSSLSSSVSPRRGNENMEDVINSPNNYNGHKSSERCYSSNRIRRDDDYYYNDDDDRRRYSQYHNNDRRYSYCGGKNDQRSRSGSWNHQQYRHNKSRGRSRSRERQNFG